MKYIFFLLIILLLLLVIVIIYLKKNSSRKTFAMPNTTKKEIPVKGNKNSNPNPIFKVELIDSKKAQRGINESTVYDSLHFKLAKNKRINVYTSNKKYLGQIAIKDYKKFSLIAKKVDYFEGNISSIEVDTILTKKVIIDVQAKIEYSKAIYNIDKSYLNTLITLQAAFIKGEIIETNYGPSTIIEVFNDHLLVEVPSLGNREIYDIESVLSRNN